MLYIYQLAYTKYRASKDNRKEKYIYTKQRDEIGIIFPFEVVGSYNM